MADLSLAIGPEQAEILAPYVDIELKLPRALEALGPISGRDVVLVDGGPRLVDELGTLGGRVSEATGGPAATGLADDSADVIVACFSAYRGVERAEQLEADRVLRPGGRLLIVHDYGRDDVARLRPAGLPEYDSWSHRDGPFLRAGFRVRVLHCWWTFESIEQAAAALESAFGPIGAELGGRLRRPRVSYNVAVYHRTVGSR